MKKYKFQKAWRHWKKDDIIEEYQYKMLPYEIKSSIGFVIPVEEANVISETISVSKPEVPINQFEKVIRTKFAKFSESDKKDEEILGNDSTNF